MINTKILDLETIIGVPINRGHVNDFLSILTLFALYKNGQKIVFTPNPEFIVKAQNEPEFKKILQTSDINLPDGIGIVMASKILGGSVRERISGSDMVEKLLDIGNKKCEVLKKKVFICQEFELQSTQGGENEMGGGKLDPQKIWIVGIVGARRGVLEEEEELVRRLSKKYPNIKFVIIADPDLRLPIFNFHVSSNSQNLKQSMVTNIAGNENSLKLENCKFNLVFACHGMGMQEKWILENRNKIKTGIFMGIGGSLDFITGFTRRAPYTLRKAWLEWLWRVLQRPSHLKRVWNAIFVFGWMLIKERLRLYTKS